MTFECPPALNPAEPSIERITMDRASSPSCPLRPPGRITLQISFRNPDPRYTWEDTRTQDQRRYYYTFMPSSGVVDRVGPIAVVMDFTSAEIPLGRDEGSGSFSNLVVFSPFPDAAGNRNTVRLAEPACSPRFYWRY